MIFNIFMGGRIKLGIKLMISCFYIMLNYQLFKKFKLIGNDEFNHLTIVLTLLIKYYDNNVIFKSATRHRHFF